MRKTLYMMELLFHFYADDGELCVVFHCFFTILLKIKSNLHNFQKMATPKDFPLDVVLELKKLSEDITVWGDGVTAWRVDRSLPGRVTPAEMFWGWRISSEKVTVAATAGDAVLPRTLCGLHRAITEPLLCTGVPWRAGVSRSELLIGSRTSGPFPELRDKLSVWITSHKEDQQLGLTLEFTPFAVFLTREDANAYTPPMTPPQPSSVLVLAARRVWITLLKLRANSRSAFGSVVSRFVTAIVQRSHQN